MSKPTMICPYDGCGRPFAKASNLSQHIRVHSGETPYPCNLCGRSFKQSGNLTKHLRSHQNAHLRWNRSTADKPFKCEVCQRSFTAKTSLQTHFRRHINDAVDFLTIKVDPVPTIQTEKTIPLPNDECNDGDSDDDLRLHADESSQANGSVTLNSISRSSATESECAAISSKFTAEDSTSNQIGSRQYLSWSRKRPPRPDVLITAIAVACLRKRKLERTEEAMKHEHCSKPSVSAVSTGGPLTSCLSLMRNTFSSSIIPDTPSVALPWKKKFSMLHPSILHPVSSHRQSKPQQKANFLPTASSIFSSKHTQGVF